MTNANEELDAGDHKSFHEAGVPAVQLFSGPHLDYHRPSDTFDRIDAEGLLKVASVAKEVVECLTGRVDPLTAILKPGKQVVATAKKSGKSAWVRFPTLHTAVKGPEFPGLYRIRRRKPAGSDQEM